MKNPGERLCLEALEVVVDSGDPILAPRILDHSLVQGFEALYRQHVRSLAVMPLRVDGSCRGAVYLNNPDASHVSTQQGSAILLSYANLLNLILPRLKSATAAVRR